MLALTRNVNLDVVYVILIANAQYRIKRRDLLAMSRSFTVARKRRQSFPHFRMLGEREQVLAISMTCAR